MHEAILERKSKEQEQVAKGNLHPIEAVAESADVARSDCKLTLNKEHVVLQWANVSKTIKYADLTHVSYGTIKLSLPTKLALASKRAGGGEGLFKIWIGLGDLEVVMQMLETAHCKPRFGDIPSILHSPWLLRFYHPWLRNGVHFLELGYRGVLGLALFFYVSNMVSLFPDVGELLWDPLMQIKTVAPHPICSLFLHVIAFLPC